jgi:hypothetical protein
MEDRSAVIARRRLRLAVRRHSWLGAKSGTACRPGGRNSRRTLRHADPHFVGHRDQVHEHFRRDAARRQQCDLGAGHTILHCHDQSRRLATPRAALQPARRQCRSRRHHSPDRADADAAQFLDHDAGADEFMDIYKLEVLEVPTNKPLIRKGRRRGLSHDDREIAFDHHLDRGPQAARPAGAGRHHVDRKIRATRRYAAPGRMAVLLVALIAGSVGMAPSARPRKKGGTSVRPDFCFEVKSRAAQLAAKQ